MMPIRELCSRVSTVKANQAKLRILVTGGAGFIGSHLVDRLMESGNNEVIVADNFFTGSKDNLRKWIGHPNFELIRHGANGKFCGGGDIRGFQKIQEKGFSAESLAPRHELGFSNIPATIAAVKNPTSKIEYDESNHERFAPGDPSKRAFTYFVLTGGRFVYASFIRLMVLKFILSMSASKDVLAMASLEVDLSSIELGSTVTVKWRGKPVFIRRRTEDDIQLANSVNVNSLRDPQEDAERVLNPEWLVVIGVCTHLGCVPLPNAGDYGGWFCPCHGSHYDISGRIRKGPAPYNLEIPTYKFLEDNKMLIG